MSQPSFSLTMLKAIYGPPKTPNLVGGVGYIGFWSTTPDLDRDWETEIGSQVEYRLSPSSPWIDSGQYVTGIGIWNSTTNVRRIHLNLGALEINGVSLDPQIRFYNCKKDYITGAYDNYKDNYVLTIANATGSKSSDELSDSYNTTAFDESVLGWTTFYSYRPNGMFSLKGDFYSYKNKGLYLHYSTNVNHNNFYNQDNDSHVIFVFNNNPSIVKNFKTINYEGSSGWRVNSFISDSTDNEFDSGSGIQYITNNDTTNAVRSYFEGEYVIVEASGEVDNNVAPDQIKLVNVIGQIIVGAPVTGPGIIPNTTVQAWNPSTLVVTLNQNVNAVRRTQLTFTTEVFDQAPRS